MARAAIRNIVFPGRFQGEADRTGSFYVYATGTTTAATVYQDATGATTLTQPISFGYNRHINGFLEPGEYAFAPSASAPMFTTQVGAAYTPANHLLSETAVSTVPGGFWGCNTDTVSLTSGTVIFAKFPFIHRPITVAGLYTHVGATESGTETDQRLGLYSSDGTTLTRIGLTAASTTLLETDDVQVGGNFTTNGTDATTVTMVPGTEYWGAIISVATTPGTVIGLDLEGIGVTTQTTETPTVAVLATAPARTLAAQTALDASEAISGTTASLIIPYIVASATAAA